MAVGVVKAAHHELGNEISAGPNPRIVLDAPGHSVDDQSRRKTSRGGHDGATRPNRGEFLCLLWHGLTPGVSNRIRYAPIHREVIVCGGHYGINSLINNVSAHDPNYLPARQCKSAHFP